MDIQNIINGIAEQLQGTNALIQIQVEDQYYIRIIVFVEVEFEYEYDMASFLSYFSNAFSLAGLSRITGINQGQLSHYVTGHRVPSARTKEKMQESIHNFAKDLAEVNFI